MKLRVGLLLLLTVNLLAAEKVQRVSLIQVIANPERFDEQQVLVVGYLELTFEGSEVYVHREDVEHHLLMSGVRIRASDAMGHDAPKINHKYVLLVGKFHAAPKESFHPAVGIIDNITEYRLWPDNTEGEEGVSPRKD
jgi:hypothetical protein